MENHEIFMLLPNLEQEELMAIKNAINGMDDEKSKEFIAIYRQRRKDQNTILGGILAGIVGIHGIHRFMLGQVGWGLVYLFTMGFCKIGWIIDLVNYRKITINYNVKTIMEMSQSTLNSRAGF